MKMSFRSQITYGIGIILTLFILTFTYVMISYQNNFLHNQTQKHAQNRAKAIATNSKIWIMSNDFVGLEEVLENFSVYDDIIFAAIINMDGKIIAHTDHSLIGKYIADSERISYLQKAKLPTKNHANENLVLFENSHHIDFVKIIHNKNQHLGFVHLRINLEAYQENILRTIYQAIIFTILAITLGIIFAYILTNILIKQLLHLVQIVKKYRDGKHNIKADENVVQEISELSHEFNTLIETLNKSEILIAELNERQQLALSASNDGIWDWNLLTNSVYFSTRWKEMLGYAKEELPHDFSEWRSRLHPEDLEKTLQAIQDSTDGKIERYQEVYRLKHKDGHWVWILARGKTIFENAKPIRMLGTHTDITKEKEKELIYTKQAIIIQQIHDSVISTDLQGKILSCNQGAQNMLGYTEKELIGKNISTLYAKEELQKQETYLEQSNKNKSFHIDTFLLNKSHKIISVTVSLSVLKDEQNKPIGFIYVAQDISKRKEAEKELLRQKKILEYQAHHDALTGLANRLLFNDRLNEALINAKDNSQKMALLYIDLDHFKEINHSLGHTVGDKILKSVTQKLNNTIQDKDTLARLGGDEFIIMLENIADEQEISNLAKKIINILSFPITIEENILYISCSIGISFYPDDGDFAGDLLKYADSAMYKAKDEGRNNFQFYSAEMTQLALQRVEMETGIREALNNEEFLVYYQPQVNGDNAKLIGMEALVRWQHPKMGLISPARFIPIAEATGLIVELDRFVMRTAIRQFVQWYKEGFNPGILAINLTVKQIQQKDFIEVLSLIHI